MYDKQLKKKGGNQSLIKKFDCKRVKRKEINMVKHVPTKYNPLDVDQPFFIFLHEKLIGIWKNDAHSIP